MIVLQTVTRNVQTSNLSAVHKELLCNVCFGAWLEDLLSIKAKALAKDLGEFKL